MSVTTYDGHENSVPLPPIPVGLPSSDVLYVLPANAQANWKPIYDDPSKQVIGFYTISSNIKHIYDIEGKFVTISEPGLESSYIIDDIIFLLVGIGEIRYILRGGRELIAVAGRRAGRAAVYGITAGIISESAITGLRVAFRQLATRQVFRLRRRQPPAWRHPVALYRSTFYTWRSNLVRRCRTRKASTAR